jgi:hypothetical protein
MIKPINWIKKILGIHYLSEMLKRLAESQENCDLIHRNNIVALKELEKAHMNLRSECVALRKDYEKFRKMFMAGADINTSDRYRSSSWAVISIKGKQDIVRFYELSENDIRGISDFLQKFSDARVDAGPDFKLFLRSRI